MGSSSEHEVALDALMPLIRECLSAGQSVQLSPKGTSMLPMLRQGIDKVTLAPLPSQLKKYDLPLYRRDNGQYVLHRIVGVGETYTCVGDNQFDLETELRQEQMIAVVTSFTRGEKRYSANHIAYRIYCHCWHTSRPVRHFYRRAKHWLRRHLK